MGIALVGGIELLKQGTYDLVSCDMMIPDIDGENVYRAWCSGSSRDAMFVSITGDAFTNKAQDFIDQSAVAVCYRPMNVPVLRDLVDQALRQCAGADAYSRKH